MAEPTPALVAQVATTNQLAALEIQAVDQLGALGDPVMWLFLDLVKSQW